MAKKKNLRDHVSDVAKIKKLAHKPIYDLDINEYHGMTGTYSSSQFKDLLYDQDLFIAKYIHKTIARQESAAFDIGSYFHTGILEPHKLRTDCIVYPGKVRHGKAWEKFQAENKGKTIVSQSQKDQAEGLVQAVKDSPVAQNYLDGRAEVSLITEIQVHEGRIYAPYYGKVLTIDGWVNGPVSKRPDAFTMYIRVRADMLGKTYISDLKSTSGNAKSNQEMRNKVNYYQYDLSAALYMDMFNLYFEGDIKEFVWIFASKDMKNSKSYVASDTSIRVGRAKCMRGMILLADCASNNWESVDYLDTIEPLPQDLEYLREKDADLL